MARVSVLMAVYRTKEEYLREAIESILGQTYKDFEFLILDDCPEDPRQDIVCSYKDVRIKYILNEKNMGISAARNKLIDLSKGQYLAVFDHDDISLPERFEKQVAFLDAHQDVGVVSSNIKLMTKAKDTDYPLDDHNIKLSLMLSCTLIHPAAMIRKSVLTQNHISYDETFSPSEDHALWCALIPFTKFHNLSETLLYYRDHCGNTSHANKRTMSRATARLRARNSLRFPELWAEQMYISQFITEIKLFGALPLLKIIRRGNKTKIFLFNFILIFKFYARNEFI